MALLLSVALLWWVVARLRLVVGGAYGHAAAELGSPFDVDPAPSERAPVKSNRLRWHRAMGGRSCSLRPRCRRGRYANPASRFWNLFDDPACGRGADVWTSQPPATTAKRNGRYPQRDIDEFGGATSPGIGDLGGVGAVLSSVESLDLPLPSPPVGRRSGPRVRPWTLRPHDGRPVERALVATITGIGNPGEPASVGCGSDLWAHLRRPGRSGVLPGRSFLLGAPARSSSSPLARATALFHVKRHGCGPGWLKLGRQPFRPTRRVWDGPEQRRCERTCRSVTGRLLGGAISGTCVRSRPGVGDGMGPSVRCGSGGCRYRVWSRSDSS